MSLGMRLWKRHLQTYLETSQNASAKTALAKRLREKRIRNRVRNTTPYNVSGNAPGNNVPGNVPENAPGKRHRKPCLGNVPRVVFESVSEQCIWKRTREMILDRKHPGKVLWKTCELQGLGGVFHTSSNSRHSGKNVDEETSPKNVPGKCLWGSGSAKGT